MDKAYRDCLLISTSCGTGCVLTYGLEPVLLVSPPPSLRSHLEFCFCATFLLGWIWPGDQCSPGAQAYFLPTPAGTCPTSLSLLLFDSWSVRAGPSLGLAPVPADQCSLPGSAACTLVSVLLAGGELGKSRRAEQPRVIQY